MLSFILKNKHSLGFFLRPVKAGYCPTSDNMPYKAIVIKSALNWHRNESACQYSREKA